MKVDVFISFVVKGMGGDLTGFGWILVLTLRSKGQKSSTFGNRN